MTRIRTNRLPSSAISTLGRTLVCDTPSHLGAAEGMCLLVRHFLLQISMPEQVFMTELVLRECLNNAIHHGNGGDPDKRIKVTVTAEQHRIRLRVADQGKGFDWRKMTRASLPNARVITGRGLAMVASYASRIRFNPKGNVISVDISRGRRCPPTIE